MITDRELRKKFFDYFESKGHVKIPSAPLVPEHDPTVLFTTAGMHPLVPFLLGEDHPAGQKLCNIQKCLRTGDIDEVGDEWHSTLIEMLGFWSLGAYFKKEAIAYSYEFLTDPKWLGIDPARLSVTVFEGDKNIPKDEESANYWMSHGIPEERIYFLDKSENWWGLPGNKGPCGPDTEIFYDTGQAECGPECRGPACSCGKFVEIWNNVFLEYNGVKGKYLPLKQKNVDTGIGLERLLAVLNGQHEIYATELYQPIIKKIQELESISDDTSEEIIADHIRAATFLIGDGVSPSNLDQGYVLRRLIRRAIRYGKKLDIEGKFLKKLAEVVIEINKDFYPNLADNKKEVYKELEEEEEKFQRTLEKGLKQLMKVMEKLQKGNMIPGVEVFHLYDTYGFPKELTDELAHEKGFHIDEEGYLVEFKKHQEKSRTGSEEKFKGGLLDDTEISKKYHTATHLLHQALREVLGKHVEQKGSNITAERMRFDFSHPEKLTEEELRQVEDLVNSKIQEKMPISCREMTLEEAEKTGAIGLFKEKYGGVVKLYEIGEYSKEICGGPHVDNTLELGKFKILKEKSASAGIRRIKAVIEPLSTIEL
ncbi:alanine--tRNA ligase [Patescibacteria group bacterium]|nr:alanine--tRNA ligase [Patescibacteria group bacterium]MBU1672829.1 alanine--tRNA ligase [Patescibacteria group bacterium]